MADWVKGQGLVVNGLGLVVGRAVVAGKPGIGGWLGFGDCPKAEFFFFVGTVSGNDGLGKEHSSSMAIFFFPPAMSQGTAGLGKEHRRKMAERDEEAIGDFETIGVLGRF